MIACYSRVSTAEQAINGHSIGEQNERMQKYCDAMGWHNYQLYTDAGYSGANTDRPALQRMIKDIELGKITKIVVYKLDRLSRSQKDTLLLIEDIFIKNNCDFISMSENFDTSSAFGRAMIGVLSVFAQLEREQIKERMMMGKDARSKKGKWHGGMCPIGYDYVDGNLVINEYNAMQVREIFNYCCMNMPIRKIETTLREKGYKNQYDSYWNAHQIRRTLANKTYLGYIKSKTEWIKADHESIIDEETFNKVRKIMDARHIEFVKSGIKTGVQNQSTYLGGIIYCAHCGAKYSKCMVGSRYMYGCYSRHKKMKSMIKDQNCKNKYYLIKDLDNIVINEILKLKFEKITAKDNQSGKKEILEKELAKIDSQISRFLDLYGIGRYNVEQLDEKILPLEIRRDDLKRELSKIDESNKLNTDEAMSIADSLTDMLKSGRFDKIRNIIHALIERIDINGEDISIHWTFN